MAQLILSATQQSDLEAKITDRLGNPAPVQNPTWSSSEPATVTVTVDANNPLKAVVKAVGVVDEASMVLFEADADMGAGVVPIIATLDVVVTAGQAIVVELIAGPPAEQPAP
jgi:hypothetical protein